MYIENGAVFYDKPFVCTLDDWRTANGDCMLIANSFKDGVVSILAYSKDLKSALFAKAKVEEDFNCACEFVYSGVDDNDRYFRL